MEKHIPIVEETLEVRTRVVDAGGVRLHKQIDEHFEPVSLTLDSEHVEVRHVPVNRVVDAPLPTRQEGDTLIIPVHEEVLVRQWILVEEVHVTRTATQTDVSGDVMLRRETLSVDRLPPDAATPGH